MSVFKSWNIGYNMALIQDINTFARLRSIMPGDIGLVSGEFNKINPNNINLITHGSSIMFARKIENTSNGWPIMVVAVIEGEPIKKDGPTVELKIRCQIMAGIRGVDIVIPIKTELNDQSIVEVIKKIRPTYLFKRENRVEIKNALELEYCEQHGIQVTTGVGRQKLLSPR